MDMLAYWDAMANFCRQRAAFENEDDAFWIREAKEWDKLISEFASPQLQNPNRTNGPRQARDLVMPATDPAMSAMPR
jgi:hypothetical protein